MKTLTLKVNVLELNHTIPMWSSIIYNLLLTPGSYNFDVTTFSTPNTTPSLQAIPIAVLLLQIK